METIWATVDASRLNAILAEHIKVSTRSAPQVVASAAYHVVKRTIELTPFVPVSRIDEELAVSVAVKISASGKALSARNSKNLLKRGGTTGVGLAKYVPLTVLIIRASQRPGSRYNMLTNNRWQRPADLFKGMSREGMAATMRAIENRMINARHSSIKFLIAGWAAVRRQLLGSVYGGAPEMSGIEGLGEKEFGRVIIHGGTAGASVTIENLIGTVGGDMGDNSANYNQALFEHGLGPLQQAIDEEAEKQIAVTWGRVEAEKIAPLYSKL
jgi:hypothetical protein